MARKTDCYVDTSAFIALLDRSDSYHSLFRRLFSDPPRLITSSLVIAEGHGWFLRYDAQRAIQFLTFLDLLPGLTVCSFDATAVQSASAVVKKFADLKLTLADAHGLSLMSAMTVGCCWSTDRHLSLDGVPLVTTTDLPASLFLNPVWSTRSGRTPSPFRPGSRERRGW